MRWAYVKNGNVVKQFRAIGVEPECPPNSGTEAFVGDFLYHIKNSPALLISADNVEESYSSKNIESKCINIRGENIAAKILLTIRSMLLCGGKLYKFKPDKIICGRLGFLLWTSFLVARIRGCTIIFSSHNGLSNSRRTMWGKAKMMFDRYCILRCDGCVCNGPYLEDQLASIGVRRDLIRTFDVNVDTFSEYIENNNKSKSASEYILYVGRIEKDKGVIDLLNAFSQIDDSHVKLVYAGDGDALNELTQEVERLGIGSRVDILGRVQHDSLKSIMMQAIAVIAPTRSEFPEGRCMVVLEALAAGRPVIAPDFGPFPYLVKDGKNGLLYNVDSVTDLTAKLALLLRDASLLARLEQGVLDNQDLLTPPASFFEAIDDLLCQQRT